MSDFCFALPPVENTPATLAEAAFVNANAVLQKVLQTIQPKDRDNIVLRCDDLPLFPGKENEVEAIFSLLLHMLLQKKTEVTRLYLHICCTKEEAVLANGFPSFTIQFHSNIVPEIDWYNQYKAQLDAVSAVLQHYKGQLVTNEVKNGSCIFSISLPGKTL